MLHGEFRESPPQNVEFHVKYDLDPNTAIPVFLRVKCFHSNLIRFKTPLSGIRKVITITNARFGDYHNILYYIYTGSLNMRYPASTVKDRPHSSAGVYSSWDATSLSFPRPANVNEIYRLAGVMKLSGLQTRAYHYLLSTCSVDNIFERLFDPYCKAATHASVKLIYQQFLAKNWDKVRNSGQWATLLRRYRATQRDEEAEFLLESICEILNAVSWDVKVSNFIHHK